MAAFIVALGHPLRNPFFIKAQRAQEEPASLQGLYHKGMAGLKESRPARTAVS
jgi:hypothetical protein